MHMKKGGGEERLTPKKGDQAKRGKSLVVGGLQTNMGSLGMVKILTKTIEEGKAVSKSLKEQNVMKRWLRNRSCPEKGGPSVPKSPPDRMTEIGHRLHLEGA